MRPEHIRTICEQLAEAGLIAFKPVPGELDGSFIGMSKISAHGSDVVEGLSGSSIALEFPQARQTPPATDSPTVLTRKDDGPSIDTQSSPALIADVESEILILKPTIWGVGIDLKKAYRRPFEGGPGEMRERRRNPSFVRSTNALSKFGKVQDGRIGQ